MKWVRQNAQTEDCCGQCAAAMLLGIGKREVMARFGHDEGTTTTEMRQLLRRGGLRVGPRMRKFASFEAIPTPRALLLGYWKKYPHWFVWNDGRIFDPVDGIIDLSKRKQPKHLRVTHYVSVTGGAR